MKIAICAGVGFALIISSSTRAQMIGSYDNFDCFNDTGEPAEGFEIDIEDIGPSDVTRIFPDNFPAGQPYIRWSTPDRAALTPVTFPDGHTGVSIIYAAQLVNGAWRSGWGASLMPGTATPIGNATPYVRNPTYTTGDSCWTLGLGTLYPTSGCDHFGISLNPGVTPGLMTMHWLVPDPASPGHLKQAGTVASLPPGPTLTQKPVGPGQPPVVHVAGEGPKDDAREALGQCSDAYWLKAYTSFSPQQADLNKLQKGLLPMKGPGVRVTWQLLQHCAPAVGADTPEIENEAVPRANAQMIKRHEYYRYNGSYDDIHDVQCGGDGSCSRPVRGLNGVSELGGFVGAHNMAYDVK